MLLAEHAAWSGSPRHLLLAAEWCREQLGSSAAALQGGSLDGAQLAGLGLGSGDSALAAGLGGRGGGGRSGGGGRDPRVLVARVIARADEPLPQPRARF